MSILFLLTACLWIIFTAKLDAEHINKNEFIFNHRSRFITRVLTGIFILFFSYIGAIVLALLFWALFDTVLNIFRDKHPFYLGSVANTDKFFKNKYKMMITSKIISLITSIILLFVYGL